MTKNVVAYFLYHPVFLFPIRFLDAFSVSYSAFSHATLQHSYSSHGKSCVTASLIIV